MEAARLPLKVRIGCRAGSYPQQPLNGLRAGFVKPDRID
jgi:hypothetical protein